MSNLFEGRTLLIATKHQKEQIMAPLLEKNLNVTCLTNTRFDTDTLGTFTGEIERKNDVLSTLRNKCSEAASLHSCDLVVASEGSFGPHPLYYFAACDEEVLLLCDFLNQMEWVAKFVTVETNFKIATVTSEETLFDFIHQVQFPSHAVILRGTINKTHIFHKGIQSEDELLQRFFELQKLGAEIQIETDMRAHMNPTRMKAIEEVTQNLIKKISNLCPACACPGFDVVEVIPGLPCQWCKNPTKSTLSFRYACKKCDYQENVDYPNEKEFEDPAYCDFCNP